MNLIYNACIYVCMSYEDCSTLLPCCCDNHHVQKHLRKEKAYLAYRLQSTMEARAEAQDRNIEATKSGTLLM